MCGQPDRIEQTAIGQRRRIVNCKTMLRDFPSFIQIDHRIKVGRERDHVAVSYMSPAVSGDCRPKHPPLSPCVVADFQDGCRKITSNVHISSTSLRGKTQATLHNLPNRSRSQTSSVPLCNGLPIRIGVARCESTSCRTPWRSNSWLKLECRSASIPQHTLIGLHSRNDSVIMAC